MPEFGRCLSVAEVASMCAASGVVLTCTFLSLSSVMNLTQHFAPLHNRRRSTVPSRLLRVS